MDFKSPSEPVQKTPSRKIMILIGLANHRILSWGLLPFGTYKQIRKSQTVYQAALWPACRV
jgi:hypothetical protein